MKRWYYILGSLAFLFIAIQFVPNDLPAVTPDNENDIIASGLVSEELKPILVKSCYSCHSNQTEYPWYSHVAPSSWLVAKDVREGREELNFSTWTEYDLRRKLSRLEDIAEEVNEELMPMPIYTFMHPSARLTDEQRKLIVNWAEGAMDVLVEEDDEEDM